jgi:hypothetical protein
VNACARRSKFGRAAAWASALIACAPAAAWAGAWTEPHGEGLMIATLWGWTGVGSPWGGNPAVKQKQADLQTYVEYGLTDQLTVFGQMGIERYELSPPTANAYTGLGYSDAGLRAKLWSTGQWVFSGEAAVFIPGAKNPKAPAQAGNTGIAADGRLLAGYSFNVGSIPGFVDFELGYRVRTAGPPDEWHADLTVGLKPWPGVIVMAQDFSVVSMPSTNRSFPAWRQNVVEASLVMPVWDKWSLQVGLFTSLVAVKTNTERGLAVAVWRKF